MRPISGSLLSMTGFRIVIILNCNDPGGLCMGRQIATTLRFDRWLRFHLGLDADNGFLKS